MYLQQGDILLKRVENIPEALKVVPGNLLHQGANHHHLLQGDFEMLEGCGDTFVLAKGEYQLTHPEHKTVTIPQGYYRKDIVLEYDHFLEESRQVID